MRLKEAIDGFKYYRKHKKISNKNVSGHETYLRYFCMCAGNPELKDIKATDVLKYIDQLSEQGWNDRSVEMQKGAFRKFFEYCEIYKLPATVTKEQIPLGDKGPFKIPRVCTVEEYKKIMDVIPEGGNMVHVRNKAIIGLLWDTGARNGEICSLNTADVDTEKRQAFIHTEKSRGRRPFRHIFWTEQTNEWIKAWVGIRKGIEKRMKTVNDKDALFIGLFTRQQGNRMQQTSVCEMLRRYSNKAGIPTVNAHSMRHAMGHRIVNNGGSSWDVGNILGHSSPTSADIYTVMVGDELMDRWQKVGKAEGVFLKRANARISSDDFTKKYMVKTKIKLSTHARI